MSERVKLLLLGDSGVGKTTLVRRFLTDGEMPTAGPTMGIDCTTCNVVLQGEAQPRRLNMWDTSGAPQFRDLVEGSIHDLRPQDAVVVVYNVTRRSSFEAVDGWVELLRSAAPMQAPVMVLVGIVPDGASEDNRKVSAAEGESKANSLSIPLVAEVGSQGLHESTDCRVLRSWLLQHCCSSSASFESVLDNPPRRCVSPAKWLQPMLRCAGLWA